MHDRALHIPCVGWAAFCTQTTVQTHVFVLHHHSPCLQRVGYVQVLIHVQGRRHQRLAQLGFRLIFDEGNTVHRTNIHAGITLNAQVIGKYRLHIAVQTTLGFLCGQLGIKAKFYLNLQIVERGFVLDQRAPTAGLQGRVRRHRPIHEHPSWSTANSSPLAACRLSDPYPDSTGEC